MIDTAKPVFIIGGSRTGSEMLKTMLTASAEIDLVDELFLMFPRWLHKDLDSNIRKYVGKLSNPGSLDRLMDLLYSKRLYGWFWSVVDRELDRKMLYQELVNTELDLRSVFQAIMVVHARMRGKNRIGAKFPIHYSYTDKLLQWYPECRIIHTTRNPKAVYASQAAKYITDDHDAVARGLIRFQHFVHINIQTWWTARWHRRLCQRPNYCLARYEDIVRNPGAELRRICRFAEVEFIEAMLQPHQYGSSFDTIAGGKGVNPSSLDRWRVSISPTTARLIDLAHRSAIKSFGY